MGLVAQVALVAVTPSLTASEVTRIAAALQRQIARDLIRYWELEATISAFVQLNEVPPGYWPIIVRDDIDNEAAGVHCDNSGQPMALVTFDNDWSITASHEMLEMLVDPFGNRMVAGQSVKPDQGRVEYLVEVADPVGDSWYWIDDVKVCDFITPRFFDPIGSAGVQYCSTGALKNPRELLANGYLTWQDPVGGEWWQQSRFTEGEAVIVNLGPLIKNACGMRSAVDPLAARRRRNAGGRKLPSADAIEYEARRKNGLAASKRAKADAWRKVIAQIRSRP